MLFSSILCSPNLKLSGWFQTTQRDGVKAWRILHLMQISIKYGPDKGNQCFEQLHWEKEVHSSFNMSKSTRKRCWKMGSCSSANPKLPLFETRVRRTIAWKSGLITPKGQRAEPEHGQLHLEIGKSLDTPKGRFPIYIHTSQNKTFSKQLPQASCQEPGWPKRCYSNSEITHLATGLMHRVLQHLPLREASRSAL